MYGISSALASQTINKNTVWECLLALGKVSGSLTQFISDRMIVEGWAVGVRVVVRRGYKGIQIFKGLSTIISPLKVAIYIMERTMCKSVGLNVIRKSERLFLVDSFQNPKEKHVVTAHPDGLVCSCMKFKCLQNRVEKEAPQLLKALGEITLLDGSKLCVSEYYNYKTRNIESKIHLQCHHIRAVMKVAFNAFTSLEYAFNWKQVIKSYKPNSDDWTGDEQWEQESEFFPEYWGEFKRKTS